MRKRENHKILKEKLKIFLNENFDLQERIRFFKIKKIHTLEIELTSTCNLSCFYCYANQKKYSASLSLEKAKEIINKSKSYGIKKIVWLGGEPTLNPNWREIIEYSKKQNLSNESWSNGTTLLDNAEIITKNCDKFVLHLDSINPDIFASAQENKVSLNIHTKILQGLDYLLEIGYSPEKIRLNIVLSKKTILYLKETMKYFYPQKVSSITLIPLFTIGKGGETNQNLFLKPRELQEAFEFRALIENRPERLLTGTSEYDKWYQMTTAYISSNGNVTPYAGIKTSAGNIYRDNLRKTLETSFDLLSFSQGVKNNGKTNNINGVCGNCENSGYCFGTRANSFFTSGNFLESDNTCWK